MSTRLLNIFTRPAKKGGIPAKREVEEVYLFGEHHWGCVGRGMPPSPLSLLVLLDLLSSTSICKHIKVV